MEPVLVEAKLAGEKLTKEVLKLTQKVDKSDVKNQSALQLGLSAYVLVFKP